MVRVDYAMGMRRMASLLEGLIGKVIGRNRVIGKYRKENHDCRPLIDKFYGRFSIRAGGFEQGALTLTLEKLKKYGKG